MCRQAFEGQVQDDIIAQSNSRHSKVLEDFKLQAWSVQDWQANA